MDGNSDDPFISRVEITLEEAGTDPRGHLKALDGLLPPSQGTADISQTDAKKDDRSQAVRAGAVSGSTGSNLRAQQLR